jgi:hypothetical protein
MKRNLRNASATIVLVWLALTSFGCAGGNYDTGGSELRSSTVTPGSAGRAGTVTGRGSGGAGNTGIAGSSAIGAAGRGDLSSAGGGAMRGAAGSGGTGNTGSVAGSGSQAGAGAIAGSNASGGGGTGGRAGSRASGSGGTNAPASGGTGGSPIGGGQIWMPKPGATWQWQLTGRLDTSVDAQMYDIDLFSSSAETIQMLHSAGRIVVCYFSAGSYEPDRPDSDALEQTGLGSALDGWPDEKWLDIRSTEVRDLMKARLDLAKSKGCDGVEPDNVDGFDNTNGLGLTMQDALDYDRFLAAESHARGLSVGLKNSLSLVSSLVSSFDWALDEECLQYDECDSLEPFIDAGKAVFHCEYGTSANGICGDAPDGFSTIVKNLDLDAFRIACD